MSAMPVTMKTIVTLGQNVTISILNMEFCKSLEDLQTRNNRISSKDNNALSIKMTVRSTGEKKENTDQGISCLLHSLDFLP